jgi:hypothetical protein
MGLMNSKERLLASWRGNLTDHIPLTFQYFGNLVPKHLRWTGAEGEIEVRRYYTVTAGVEVRQAVTAFGSSGRFILHPIDALSPDTPWEGIEMLIEAWQKYHSGL